MELHFDPFGTPLCAECRRHWGREGDRLDDSFRAVIASGEDFGEVKRAYFRAFHEGGHTKNAEELAVDQVEDRPLTGFRRWREENGY